MAAYAEEAQRPRDRKEHRDVKKQPVASSPSSSDPLSVIGAACAFPGASVDGKGRLRVEWAEPGVGWRRVERLLAEAALLDP